MEFKTVAATLNNCIGGDAFTLEQLEKLAASAPCVPVIENFNNDKKVGCVISAQVDDGKLIIDVDMRVDPHGRYIVPGYTVPDYRTMSFGLVDKPADQSLQEI